MMKKARTLMMTILTILDVDSFNFLSLRACILVIFVNVKIVVKVLHCTCTTKKKKVYCQEKRPVDCDSWAHITTLRRRIFKINS